MQKSFSLLLKLFYYDISHLNVDSCFSGSPGRLTVRFLTTIPSAAENSMQMEDEQPSAILVSPSKEHEGSLYAILHTAPAATPARRQSIVTLHPTESMNGLSTNISSQNNNTAEPGPSS